MSDAATIEFLANLEREHRRADAPAPASGRLLRMQKVSRGAVEGAYDAAQTNDLNKRYWENADLLNADAANNPGVRRTIRSRARYEVFEGNSFARGIIGTLANDLIGRGPRLQVTLPHSVDPTREKSTQIEQAFNAWSQRIHLARKLRTLKQARTVDGEGFAHVITNRRLPWVQLDLALVEADQIASPDFFFESEQAIDGIRYDSDGNPILYHKLKVHPGAIGWSMNVWDKDDIPAEEMVHTFRQDRPGQRRGISEIATALPLFALLRDYTLAVLHNARSAAKFTALLKTQSGAYSDDGDRFDSSVEPFDFVDIDYDMMTSLPHGWDMQQLKAEQPTTTYEMFRNAILNEIARCVHMPFNIAAGNSSDYNYASGRLDHQTYFKAIQVERSEWEIDVLDRLLLKWLEEAMFLPNLLPSDLPAFGELPHQWFWDNREHVDPAKEAQGQSTRLNSGTTHRAREYAQAGLDVDAEDRTAAESYGVSVEEYRRALFAAHFTTPTAAGPANDDDDVDEEDDETSTRKTEQAAT